MGRFRVLLALIGLLAPLPAVAGGLAFVMNSDSASISLIDMTTLKELKRIPTLREPHHWALTPDGRSLVVGDSSGNELLFFDPQTGVAQRQIPVADPYQLGFSPDGKYLVVNGLARNQTDIYSVPDYKLVKRVPLRSMPSHLAFAPDSGRVFISLQGSNRLVAIDLRSMQVLWDKPVGNTPAGVLWHDGRLLVADMGTDYLADVDPADGRVVSHVVTGKGAHNLFLSPDRRAIWVNNRVAGTITVLDAKTLTPIRTYRLSGGPDDLMFAADGKVWITRRFAESVAVLDPGSGEVHEIEVGRSPHGIFLNRSAEPGGRLASGGGGGGPPASAGHDETAGDGGALAASHDGDAGSHKIAASSDHGGTGRTDRGGRLAWLWSKLSW
jgi:YVTN family beta-propeller protein